jgi:hypothetical protein
MENNNNEQPLKETMMESVTEPMDEPLKEMVTESVTEPMDVGRSVHDLTVAVKKALEEIAVRIYSF